MSKRTSNTASNSTPSTSSHNSDNKENTMNASFKLFSNMQAEEVQIDWQWDETKSYTENLSAITTEVENKKVNIFVTTLHPNTVPYFVDERSYEGTSALGAVTNTVLHQTYSGTIGDEIGTQKGCHVFNSSETFEHVCAVVKKDSAVWDMIPVKPNVNVFDPQWLALVDRNGSKFLRRLTGNEQGDINRQTRCHDYVDLLLERDLRIWVAPIRKLLAAHLMSWLTPDKASEFRRNGYDNAQAKQEVRTIESKHKLVNADLKSEEEMLSEPKEVEALPIVMCVFKSKNTVDVRTLVGKTVDVYMKPSSFSPFSSNLSVTESNLWKFQDLSKAGYLIKVREQ
jgi:hypothetical protein